MFAAFQDFESKLRPAEQKLQEIQRRRLENKEKALAEIEALKEKAKQTIAETAPVKKRLPTSPCKATLLGHTDSVNAIVFIPRYSEEEPIRLVSGSGDGTIRVWNLQTWECEKVIKCGEIPACDDEVFCLLVLENVKQEGSKSEPRSLLVSGLPGTLKIWCTDTWKCIKVIEDAHKEDISQLVHIKYQSKAGFATGSMDHTLKLWNANDWSPWCTLTGHSDSVLSMASLYQGTILASGSDDCSIRIWDCNKVAKDKELPSLKTLSYHSEFVNDLAVCTAGKEEKLISASGDFTVCVWNTKSWSCERVLDKGNIATHLVGKGNVLIVASLSEKSDYQQCFMNAWMTSGANWRRQNKSPTIPPPQCILAVDPSPKKNSAVQDSTGAASAPGAVVNKLLIVTGEGDGFEDGEFPVFVWTGSGDAPARTWDTPANKAAREKPAVQGATASVKAADAPSDPPDEIRNAAVSSVKTHSTAVEKRENETLKRRRVAGPRGHAGNSGESDSEAQEGVQTGGLIGDELVKSILRPLLHTHGISLEMRILIDSCLRLPSKS